MGSHPVGCNKDARDCKDTKDARDCKDCKDAVGWGNALRRYLRLLASCIISSTVRRARALTW